MGTVKSSHDEAGKKGGEGAKSGKPSKPDTSALNEMTAEELTLILNLLMGERELHPSQESLGTATLPKVKLKSELETSLEEAENFCEPDLPIQYDVEGTPTFVFIRDKKVLEKFAGGTESELKTIFHKHYQNKESGSGGSGGTIKIFQKSKSDLEYGRQEIHPGKTEAENKNGSKATEKVKEKKKPKPTTKLRKRSKGKGEKFK